MFHLIKFEKYTNKIDDGDIFIIKISEDIFVFGKIIKVDKTKNRSLIVILKEKTENPEVANINDINSLNLMPTSHPFYIDNEDILSTGLFSIVGNKGIKDVDKDYQSVFSETRDYKTIEFIINGYYKEDQEWFGKKRVDFIKMKCSRKSINDGDVFAIQIIKDFFIYGRVLKSNIKNFNKLIDGCHIIYIFKVKSKILTI